MACLAFSDANPPGIEVEAGDLVLDSLGQAYDERVEMSFPAVLLGGKGATTAIVVQVSGCLESSWKA